MQLLAEPHKAHDRECNVNQSIQINIPITTNGENLQIELGIQYIFQTINTCKQYTFCDFYVNDHI